MSTLIEQIKADQLVARKDHLAVHATLLTTLIGEAEMVGKNKRNGAPTDEEVQAVVTKFVKGNTETLAQLPSDDSRVGTLQFENDILSVYLPTQMSDDVLRNAIATIGNELGLHSPKDMGMVMKALKERHGGSYDGKTASVIVKEYLNG